MMEAIQLLPKIYQNCLFFLIFLFVDFTISHWTEDLDLPFDLLIYAIHSDSLLRQKCQNDTNCPIKLSLSTTKLCWGYENDCDFENSYSFDKLECPEATDWPNVQCKSDQRKLFNEQADFGRITERLLNMKPVCSSKFGYESTVICSENLHYCNATNIFFDLKSLNAPTSTRYRNYVIHKGEVGGKCDQLDAALLTEISYHEGYLESWINELRHFESYDTFRVNQENCDVIFDRPTVIIKLDASVNMYHHFCDFVNLYLSQHINGSFSKDIDILWWDTENPVELLVETSFIYCQLDGCHGSGLFSAFSRHILHRLKVRQSGPLQGTVRITLLSRNTTYRRIANENQLFDALKSLPQVRIVRVDYNYQFPFVEQLKNTHNSDIFIGMHGSGLTHLLFLPDWAGVFELYNCDDVRCYRDLARLRGVKYWTWQKEWLVVADFEGKHPTLDTPHKKFANYHFDVPEFVRIVELMLDYVRKHPKFVKKQNTLVKEEL